MARGSRIGAAGVLLGCLAGLLGAAPGAPAQTASVVTFHNANSRAGDYVVHGLTVQQAARMHRDTGFSGTVNGHVYAQPLYWNPGGGAAGRILVATEWNHVVALDAATGATVWDRALGPAVLGSALPCGNISPVGVTGTPVIDAGTGTLYVAAQVSRQGAPAALVYAIALADGTIRPGWPLDIGVALAARGLGFAADVQGQRGALALADGQVYVPFGGRNGDCGAYHGWVVGVALAAPALTGAWQTRAAKGGIWAVGGAVAVDGSVYVATGNTAGATGWGDGEAVIRLPHSLQPAGSAADYFAPANWQLLDSTDLDLGGTNPMPVNAGGRRLMVALGKDGNAYLLDRTNLGGIGGQLAVVPVSSSRTRAGPASWSVGRQAFLAFAANGAACPGSRQGLVALRITGGAAPAIATAWCAALSGGGSPIVTTTDGRADRIVWVVGADGDDRLHGFDAATGATLFAGGNAGDRMANVHHFSTILAAAGRLYVPGDGRIYAFAPQ